MTASEITMKREDEKIAWGFRLTGGADLGTPFYVVKVLGRGAAERAGLRVGDMVYAINHKYVTDTTHKDAQNIILHTGDTLVLNIKRGCASGRGTPLPSYSPPLMGLAPLPEPEPPVRLPPPPYEPPPLIIKDPTPPESEEEEEEDEVEVEETVAAFTVKINPKGRIAAIEELPVTPPPSRSSSRCRSRSRSASKDRRRSCSRKRSVKGTVQQKEIVAKENQSQNSSGAGMISQKHVQDKFFNTSTNGVPGPGESFTYSKETVSQYSTVLSASERCDGPLSENITESFIIHGGSEHRMEDILSPEDIERDIFEEKMEEKMITELLTGEAEVLDEGIVGINFQKIIPKTDFIKDSSVFKVLQGERLKKEESEEEQLKKDPNKRFSTFLQTPKRPQPKPKPKSPTMVLPWKQRLDCPEPEVAQPLPPSPPPIPLQVEELQCMQGMETYHSTNDWSVSENTMEVDEVVIQEMRTELICDEMCERQQTIVCEAVSSGTGCEQKTEITEEVETVKETSVAEERKNSTEVTIVYKSEFERQLAEIQRQIESIQQLPSLLQANLTAVQEQLNRIVEAKLSADQAQNGEISRDTSDNCNNCQLPEQTSETKEEQTEEVKEENTEEPEVLTLLENGETIVVNTEQEVMNEECHEVDQDDSEVANTIRNGLNVEYENMKNLMMQQERDNNPSVAKPKMIRNFPRNVAERPIVLPGGRKWYKPKDAYHEDFIAETIIHQSQVLVGTTIGLNFCKYEPPKFDAANSSVYRLIKEMEERSNGGSRLPIETRPEKVLAEEDYFPPISKRHFFAAKLTEQIEVPEHVDKLLSNINEEEAVSV